jgi:hypothetical protein
MMDKLVIVHSRNGETVTIVSLKIAAGARAPAPSLRQTEAQLPDYAKRLPRN